MYRRFLLKTTSWMNLSSSTQYVLGTYNTFSDYRGYEICICFLRSWFTNTSYMCTSVGIAHRYESVDVIIRLLTDRHCLSPYVVHMTSYKEKNSKRKGKIVGAGSLVVPAPKK